MWWPKAPQWPQHKSPLHEVLEQRAFTQATRGWLTGLRVLCDTPQSRRERISKGRGWKGNPGLWVRNSHTDQTFYLSALQKGSNKQTRRCNALISCSAVFSITLPSVGRPCAVPPARLVFGRLFTGQQSTIPEGVGPGVISSLGHTSSRKLLPRNRIQG